MTSKQKSTILRLRAEGCKYVTIAAQTGISVNTVKSFCLRHSQTVQNVQDTQTSQVAPEELPDNTSHCKQCGEVLVQKSGSKPRKFCSDKCRSNWWKHHSGDIHKKAYYTKTCAQCGKTYTVYGRPNSKFCCRACASQYRVKNTEAGV